MKDYGGFDPEKIRKDYSNWVSLQELLGFRGLYSLVGLLEPVW